MDKTFKIGGERSVQRLGYGAMRLTGQPGNFGPYADRAAGVALLRRAVELGIDFFDTAHSYGPVANEELLGEALAPFGEQVFIATKAGVSKRGPSEIVVDASPQALRAQVQQSLTALKRERIDLLQLHRVDPRTPLAESVQAMAQMQREGLVRFIGLSNVMREQFDAARAIAPISSVQNRYNKAERGDDGLVDHTAGLGVAYIPYGPLGAHPMQRGALLPAQESLRRLLERSPNVIVIPGTTSLKHLEENVNALSAR